MGRRATDVDPEFTATLRRLRDQAGMSYAALGAAARYDRSYIWELEHGRKRPTAETARHLDDALGAGGKLAALVWEDPGPDVDADRLSYVAARPRSVDPRSIDGLRAVLTHQRVLEDSIGSAALVGPVAAQMDTVEQLVINAAGTVRSATVAMAANWAQFSGWLHMGVDDTAGAQRRFAQALEWSAETGDATMTATVLSFQGHLAFGNRQYGPTVGLSAAAQRDQGADVGQRAYATCQEARGLAALGDIAAALSRLRDLDHLAAETAETPVDASPWCYYRQPGFFALEAGGVHLQLAQRDRDHAERAIELLTAGMTATPEEVQGAEWVGDYLCQIGEAHAIGRDRAGAVAAWERARKISASAHSNRLANRVDSLVRRYQAA